MIKSIHTTCSLADLQAFFIPLMVKSPLTRSEFIFLRLLLICIDRENKESDLFIFCLHSPQAAHSAHLTVRLRDSRPVCPEQGRHTP